MIETVVELLPHQHEFIFAKEKGVLLLTGIGCIAENTKIETIDGVRNLLDITEPTEYKSFNGLTFDYRLGSVPFPKGKGDLYRVVHEQGEFVAFEQHRVFCCDYKYRSLVHLLTLENKSYQSLFQTNSESYPLTPFLNVQHSTNKALGYLCHCLTYSHPYDAQFQTEEDNDQAFVPSLSDVLKFFRTFSLLISEHRDDFEVQELTHIHHGQSIYHRSKMDFFRLLGVQLLTLVNHIEALSFEHALTCNQQSLQSGMMTTIHHIKTLFAQYHLSYSPTNTQNKIVSIEKVKHDWYFDLIIPNTNNYVAEGCLHHNSGKTFAGCHFVINKSITDGAGLGFIAANTYTQLQNVVLSTLFHELERLCVPWAYKENKKLLTINGSKIITASLENYEMHRGLELSWFWMDESRDAKEAAFLVLLGRLRDKRARIEYRLTSSSKGFDWNYDYFAGDKKTPDVRLVKAKTTDNVYLPEGYVNTLRQNYDEQMQKQELDGAFINIYQGCIYYAFKRETHITTDAVYHPGQPVLVGMDFNVNPFTCVFAHFINGRLYVFDELFVKNFNTPDAGKYIKEKYGTNVRIAADSTGDRRDVQTTDGVTNHAILRDFGFIVQEEINPHRVDRYNAVNNAIAKNWVAINPKCKETIKDLEQTTYKQKTDFPDTSDPMRTHISDGLGYLICFAFPFRKKQNIITSTRFR